MTNPSKLLFVPDVADRLRKSEQAIRWLVHTRQIVAPAKIGGRLVWREADLEEWLDRQFETTEASA